MLWGRGQNIFYNLGRLLYSVIMQYIVELMSYTDQTVVGGGGVVLLEAGCWESLDNGYLLCCFVVM